MVIPQLLRFTKGSYTLGDIDLARGGEENGRCAFPPVYVSIFSSHLIS